MSDKDSKGRGRVRRTFRGDFRTAFGRGLAVLLPSVLTLWIVVQAYLFVENRIARPINDLLRETMVEFVPRTFSTAGTLFEVTDEEVDEHRESAKSGNRIVPDPDAARHAIRSDRMAEWWRAHWYTRFVGMIVAVLLIYLVGRMIGGFLGRAIYHRIERFITALPVFKQVYPYVKQVVDFLFGSGDKRIQSSSVVLVEYPRKGIWTVGLMTGETMRAINDISTEDCVTVFIPSSPTPFTGYTITVPRAEVLELPVTIDEALRFIVTGGVLVPESQLTDTARAAAAAAALKDAGGPKTSSA